MFGSFGFVVLFFFSFFFFSHRTKERKNISQLEVDTGKGLAEILLSFDMFFKYRKLFGSVPRFHAESSGDSCCRRFKDCLGTVLRTLSSRRKTQSVFLSSVRKKSAIPLSFAALPVYFGN